MVEGSRTGLTLDKHLNDNNSDRRPRRSTESNRKPLSKGIESPTVLDVGNTEALRGRHKNVTGRSCRSFGNPAACNKQDPILFPLYSTPTTRHVDSVTKNIGVLAKPGGTEGDFSKFKSHRCRPNEAKPYCGWLVGKVDFEKARRNSFRRTEESRSRRIRSGRIPVTKESNTSSGD